MKIGKIKVSFFLSSGQKLTIKCKDFEMSKLYGTKGKRELNFNGADRIWSIDLDEVIGITAKKCLF